MLNYIKFYANVFFGHFRRTENWIDLQLYRPTKRAAVGRQKIEVIQGNGPFKIGEIRLNPATIALAKFFANIIAGSIGFRRVAELAIGFVRKAAVDDRRLHIFWTFFKFLAPIVWITLFKRSAHTQRQTIKLTDR